MKLTGNILKEARIKQQLSIAEVSMSTKINPKVLNAIEAGDNSQLPAKTFLKGFVRSYAMYLKLDVDTVMGALQQDLGEKTEVAAPLEKPAPQASASDKVAAPTISASPKVFKGLAAGGILLLIVLIVTVKNVVEKYEREKIVEPVAKTEPLNTKPEEKPADQPAATEPAPQNAETAPTGEVAAVQPTGSTETAAPVTAPTTATPPQVATPAPTIPVAPEPPAPAPAVAAKVETSEKKPEVKKTEEVKPPAPAVAEAKPEPAPEKPKTNLKNNEIILEALDKVDVSFAINDGPPTKLTLMPDQVHTIKVKGTVALDVSDGGALNIIQNGFDRGVAGDLGKPKKVRLP